MPVPDLQTLLVCLCILTEKNHKVGIDLDPVQDIYTEYLGLRMLLFKQDKAYLTSAEI